MAGADISTVAALHALGNIDHGEVVLNNDCVRGALALALHAADAAGVADLVDGSALIVARAGDLDMLVVGNELDDLLRADVDAGTAANTLFAVDLGNAVNNMHSAELAGIHAVAETYAGKAAVHIALAAEKHCGLAVLGSLVVKALNGVAFTAGAGYKRNHFHSVAGGNAHDLSDLCSSLGAGSNALVSGSFALGYSSGIAVAAGEAAAAAVCAGKAFTHRFLLGIDFDVEYLGRKREDCAEDTAENAENDNSINYRIHIIVPLIKRFSYR